ATRTELAHSQVVEQAFRPEPLKIGRATKRMRSTSPRYDRLFPGSLLRLITFEDASGQRHIGARLADRALDLSAASKLYLRDSQKPADHEPIPADMRAFFETGDAGFELARKSFEYVSREARATGISGEP